MRVQFVITSLPVGGAETLLLNLIQGMDKSGFLPEVVCLKEPGALGERIAQEVPLHSHFLTSKWDIRVASRLAKLFRERRTDAVITVGAGDKMFWGRVAAKLAGVPVVCSALHSTGWPDGVGRLNRLLTPWTSGFIACAGGHANHLIQHEGFPPSKVFMIPNGIDTDRFRPNASRRAALRTELGIPSANPTIGIVAALREEKNHRQFLESAHAVLQQFPDAHFVIVGEGPERNSIQSHISALGIGRNVHLLGNRSDTPDILAGLNIFCLTSKNEANPVSILEALACGVPVVAPDVGSIRETVIPNTTGTLTAPLSSEHTSKAIVQLLDNPHFAETMGLAGRQLVREQGSLQAMVCGYQKLISSLYNLHARKTGKPQWICSESNSIAKPADPNSDANESAAIPNLDLAAAPSVVSATT